MKQKVTNVNNETNTVTVELEFEDLKKIDMDLLTKFIEEPLIPFNFFPSCFSYYTDLSNYNVDADIVAMNIFDISIDTTYNDEETYVLVIKLYSPKLFVNYETYFETDKQYSQFEKELNDSKMYWHDYLVDCNYNEIYFSLDVLFYKDFLDDFSDFFLCSETFRTVTYIRDVYESGFDKDSDLHEQVQDFIEKLNSAGYDKLTKDELLSLLDMSNVDKDTSNEILTFCTLKGDLM